MSRFEQAKYLSELAFSLDETRKTEYTTDELASVKRCVNILHKLAINMAADRMSEIYASDADCNVPYLRHIDKSGQS